MSIDLKGLLIGSLLPLCALNHASCMQVQKSVAGVCCNSDLKASRSGLWFHLSRRSDLPPASRTTGADSPVMADSSTRATPFTISPSLGMVSPLSTATRSLFLSCRAATCSALPSGSRRRTPSPRCGPGAAFLPGLCLFLLPAPRQSWRKNGEPEPQADLKIEAEVSAEEGITEGYGCGQGCAQTHDEHHRISPERSRVELLYRVQHCHLISSGCQRLRFLPCIISLRSECPPCLDHPVLESWSENQYREEGQGAHNDNYSP